MSYEIQFARITNFGKLSDRFLNCQHSKSKDLTKSSMGEIFTLVEILSPWYTSAQIGQMIVANFSQAYYQNGSTSDLVNFENALKNINENLAQTTQNGETEWIGNLNGILATIVGNNIFISPAGKVEGYLFRDGKVNHLTYGLTEKIEVHPLKTFSNLVSGQLKNHDKLLLTTQNAFNYLSLESLRQIITLNDPATAGLQITKLLRKAKVRNVNLIIISLVTKEEIANSPLSSSEENVFYLDKLNKSVVDNLKGVWQNIISPFTKILLRSTKGLIANISATISRVRKKKVKQDKNTNPAITDTTDAKATDVKVPSFDSDAVVDNFQKEFLSTDSRDDHLLKDEEINYSPELAVHYYKDKKAQKENKLKNVARSILGKISRSLAWFYGLYKNKEKRKYFYILIALLIIIIIGLVVALKGKSGNNLSNVEAQKILDEAISAQKEAKNAISSGNIEKAKENFVISIDKAGSITQNILVSKDAESVIATSYQELDKLTSTTRFNSLKPSITIPDTAKGIFIASGEAFIVTENDIYMASLIGGKAQNIDSFPNNTGNFIAGTNLGSVIYLYTSNQNLFELDPSVGKLKQSKISADGRWETANAVSSYVGSVYLLDGIVGQIYKHTSSADAFESGEEYTTVNSSLKQSTSLAIDGSIYVLKNNGEVLKYQRSKLQDFSLKNIPMPNNKISQPIKIYTDSDTPSLYILDGGDKRILEFDKDGMFIKQFALPDDFDKITDFFVSVKSKKIWITNDKSVYEISI